MNTQQLDNHKRILGILYIVSSLLTATALLMLSSILSLILSFAFEEMNGDEQRIAELIMSLASYVPFFVICIFILPTFIAGIGLLARKSWAVILALIVGCLKLFSFPIGTAIGVYAIWIFAEDQKLSRNAQ